MTTQVAQRFQTSDILRMFPSFVWKAELRPESTSESTIRFVRTLGEIGAPLGDSGPGRAGNRIIGCTSSVSSRARRLHHEAARVSLRTEAWSQNHRLLANLKLSRRPGHPVIAIRTTI